MGDHGRNCKSISYVTEKKLENAFIDILKSFELTPAALEIVKKCLKNEMEAQNYYNENRIKELENSIEKTKNRLNKLFDLYLDGQIKENMYKEKSKEFENMLDNFTLKYSSYTRTGIELLQLSENLFELCKNTPKLYLTGSVIEKRKIVKLVCSNFLYDGKI